MRSDYKVRIILIGFTQLIEYIATETGTNTITISASDNTRTGNYQVEFQCISGPVSVRLCSPNRNAPRHLMAQYLQCLLLK